MSTSNEITTIEGERLEYRLKSNEVKLVSQAIDISVSMR